MSCVNDKESTKPGYLPELEEYLDEGYTLEYYAADHCQRSDNAICKDVTNERDTQEADQRWRSLCYKNQKVVDNRKSRSQNQEWKRKS